MLDREEGDHGPDEHLPHIVIEMGTTGLPVAAPGGRHPPITMNFAGNGSGSSPFDAAAAAVDVHALSSEDPLVDRIEKKLEKLPFRDTRPKPAADLPCICRVNPSIRQQEEGAYEPKIVSIGPLHRGKKSLLPMEKVKLAYLRDLLQRSPYNELGNYIKAIRECGRRARMQYAEELELADDEFVEMMVVDGSFIIEYFVKRVFGAATETIPLSSVRWGFSHLRRDLMLLENQIPFFVLVKLFEQSKIPFIGSRKEALTLMEIALRFLDIKLPTEEQPRSSEVLHLLHLHQLCLDPSSVLLVPHRRSCGQWALYTFSKAANLIPAIFFGLLYLVLIREWPRCFSSADKSKAPRMIPCATELVEAGVRFKKRDAVKGGVNCFIRVSFADGTLEIPFLKVEESTSSKLRNLIALEQCCPKVGSHFTSYGILMDNIINTESDVAILRGCGIIESKLGSDAEVADMFNALCKGSHIKYDEHYNAPLFAAVKEYCEFAHHKWRAALAHKYFRNPWTIISILAGILLLALTATQTYFTIFPRK